MSRRCRTGGGRNSPVDCRQHATRQREREERALVVSMRKRTLKYVSLMVVMEEMASHWYDSFSLRAMGSSVFVAARYVP